MAERKTNTRSGLIVALGVVAAALLEMGKLICADADGYAVEGSESATLTALGRCKATVDNSAGADGALIVEVERGTFLWDNSGTDAVDITCIGKTVYIEDDQTVSKTDNSSARSAAGKCLGVDAGGVWVEMG